MGKRRAEPASVRSGASGGKRKSQKNKPSPLWWLLAVLPFLGFAVWFYSSGPNVTEGIQIQTTKPDTIDVAWQKSQADSFEVRVSLDAEGSQVIATKETQRPKASIEDLPILDPGTRVFITVTSILDGEEAVSRPVSTWLEPETIEKVTSPVGSPNTVTLKWTATKNTTRYQVQRATDKKFTKGVVSTTTNDAANRLIVDRLRPNTSYYWRVRPLNGRNAGEYSDIIKAGTTGKTIDFTFATYNICSESCSGIRNRRWRMAELVAKNDVDILALQEAGGGRVGPVVAEAFESRETGLTRAEGGAKTRYIFYDAKKYRQLDGGWFKFGRGMPGAAWAKLEERRSGLRFIVVSTHLTPNDGADGQRASQTKELFERLEKINREKVPVFYGGDFNSHRKHRSDGPEKVMTANDYVNAIELSEAKPENAKVSSFRSFSTRIKQTGLHVDKIYVPKGTTVKSWKLFYKSEDGRYSGGKYSDHNPIKAVISIEVPNPK